MAKKKDCKVSIASVDRLLKAVDTDTVPVHVELEGESIDFEVKRLKNESVGSSCLMVKTMLHFVSCHLSIRVGIISGGC